MSSSAMQDPYDDFDPEDYTYRTDEEEADNVAYMEQAGTAPCWAPSLSLQLSQDTAHTQSQSQQRILITNLVPRNERRRRRHQPALYQEDDGESSSDYSSDEEDIFAAARSIIDQKLARNESHMEKDSAQLPDELPNEKSTAPLEPSDSENREHEDLSPRFHDQFHSSSKKPEQEEDVPGAEQAENDIGDNKDVCEKSEIQQTENGRTYDTEAEENFLAEETANQNTGTLNDCSNTWGEPAPFSEEASQHDLEQNHTEAFVRYTQSSFPWKESTTSSRLENELKRQRAKLKQSKQKHQREKRQGSSILDDGMQQSRTMMAALEKTRKRAQGDGSSKRDGAEERRDKRRSRVASTSPGRFIGSASATRRNAGPNSLIGARPQHWGTQLDQLRPSGDGISSTLRGRSQLLSRQDRKRLSRAAQLAEATKPRLRATIHTSSLIAAAKSSQNKRVDNATLSAQRATTNETQHRTDTNRETLERRRMHSGWKPMADTSKLTFTPAFLTTTKHPSDSLSASNEFSPPTASVNGNVLQTPAIQRRRGDGNAAFSGGSSGGAKSPMNSASPKRKSLLTSARKRIQAGPLMKRLRSIRGSIEGDCVRLQSGMYPFHKARRYDMNDPRNRAESYMDVSIVGEPVSWENKNEMLTMLAFIHSHVHKHKRSAGNTENAAVDKASVNNVGEQSPGGDRVGGFFAWMCFTFETAREKKIRRWAQLRIYNAIIMTSCESVEIPSCCHGHEIKNKSCDKVVVCTKLCEPYPTTLPRLEGVCIPPR